MERQESATTVRKQTRMRRKPNGKSNTAHLPEIAETVMRPSHGWARLELRKLRDYHELLYYLVLSNIKVRYKQTILGAAWAIIQPFSTMVVFSLFFGKLAKVPSDGIPYPIFSYTALVPWFFL